MIIGDSKGVNNRHVYFGSIKRAVMDLTLLWLPLRKCMVNSLIGYKYYVRHLKKRFLAGQAILQISQISRYV